MKRILGVATLFVGIAGFGSTAAGQEFAKARLEKSPRHHEWVKISAGDRIVQTFVAFPEVPKPVPAVIVIHENRGLTDWVKLAADEFAEAGYVALAPDLLSGMGPDGGGTDALGQGAMKALYGLKPEQITTDLNAVFEYAKGLPACNKKVAVGGFCWGGGQTFRFATNQPGLSAALVFYGPAPDLAALERIKCPVYGFYGGNDARINAGIAAAEKAMKAHGKKYEPVVYDGAGHGFMRAGDEPTAEGANKQARGEAWVRVKGVLAKL